jgi:microcystin-dependent protein
MDVIPFVGEICLWPGDFIPKGWAACDGQLLPVRGGYTSLFSLIGTQFGGDGTTTFALPDLRGRTPIGASPKQAVGTTGGQQQVTLTMANLPAHNHLVTATDQPGTDEAMLNAVPAVVTQMNGVTNKYFTGAPDTVIYAETLLPADGSLPSGATPHDNMQPYVAMTYIIATSGIHPTH